MDIREWLQNTADREPPPDEEREQAYDHGVPEHLHHQRFAQRPAVSRKRGAANKSDFASSPRRQVHKWRKKDCRISPGLDRPRLDDLSTTGSHSPYAHVRSCESEVSGRNQSSVPSQTYQRRRRRKTRPDRYEVTSKKPRKHREAKREEQKSRNKRRKSQRRTDGTRTAGIVQSFQLASGSKNSRLTLPPDISTGIFKHGRSSTRVAGVPDLVFNEMKFLQRPREHQDELPVGEASKQTIKKTRQQLHEEEVSAYFSKKPPQEKLNHSRREDRSKVPLRSEVGGKHANQPRQSISTAVDQSPIEIPKKMTPSVAGVRTVPEHTDGHVASTSACTWPDSMLTGKSPTLLEDMTTRPARRQSRNVRQDSDFPIRAQSGIERRSQCCGDEGLESASREVTSSRRAKCLAGAETERGAVQVEVRVCDGSNSIPKASQRPGTRRGVEESGDPLANNGNYHTSDILRVDNTHHDQMQSSSWPAHAQSLKACRDNDASDVAVSTPSSHLLRTALRALADPQPVVEAGGIGVFARKNNESHSQSHFEAPPPNMMPEVLDGTIADDTQARKTQAVRLPSRHYSWPMETVSSRQSRQPELMPFMKKTSRNQSFSSRSTRQEDGSLDRSVNLQTFAPLEEYICADGMYAEDLMPRPLMYQPSRLLTPTFEQHNSSETAPHLHRGIPTLIRNDRYAEQAATSISYLASREVASVRALPSLDKTYGHRPRTSDVRGESSGMEGFWQANMLY